MDDFDFLKGSHSRLRMGAALSRREMLRLALMSSENRAASSLARHYPGGTRAFVAAMNVKARIARHDAHALSTIRRAFRPRTCRRRTIWRKLVQRRRRLSADPRFHDDAVALRRSAADGPDARLQQFQRARQERGVGHPAAEDRVHPRSRQVRRDARNIASKPFVIVLLDSLGKYTRIADAQRVKHWLETGESLRQRRARSRRW